MPGVTVQIDANDKSASVLKRVGDNFTNTFDKIDRKGKQVFGTGGGTTRISAGGISGTLAGIPGHFSGAILAATKLGSAIAGMVQPAIDFEKSMANAKAVIQPTTEQMAAMQEEAQRLGSTTTFTASQAAEGFVKLGQAGLDAQQSLAALEPTLLAAEAGNLALGKAADIGTNIMSGMGLEVKDLNHIMDSLAVVASSSNTDIMGVGSAFQYAASTAKTAGVDFNTTAAALAALADTGISGSSAGTALSNMFVKMAKPSEKAVAILERANIQFTNMDGTLRDLPAIVGEVSDANLTLAEKQELFGTRGLKAYAALEEKGVHAFNEIRNSIVTSEGAAKKMADTMTDNVDGAMKRFGSAIEGLQLSLANAFLPTIQSVIDGIASVVSGFTEWINSAGGISGFFSTVGTNLGKAVSMWYGSLKGFFTNADYREQFVTNLSNIFLSIAGPEGILVTFLQGMAQTIFDAANIIWTPIQVAGELVWENITTSVSNMWQSLQSKSVEAINAMIDKINSFGKHIGVEIPKIEGDFTPLYEPDPQWRKRGAKPKRKSGKSGTR